jgi:hypothetical protein
VVEDLEKFAFGISSGKATNLMILRLQLSTLSSDRPTQARSGISTRTSPDVGECDFERVCEVVDTVSSDDGGTRAVSAFSRNRCRADVILDMEVSVLLLALVSTAPDSVMSGPKSSSEEKPSVETGDKVGETIFEVRRLGSEE